MKTIKEWLETLPEGIRERALRNYEAEKEPHFIKARRDHYETLREAMYDGSFIWDDTKEGFKFWERVAKEYFDDALKILAKKKGKRLPTPSPDTSKIEELRKEVERWKELHADAMSLSEMGTDMIKRLESEVERLKGDLDRANETIKKLRLGGGKEDAKLMG